MSKITLELDTKQAEKLIEQMTTEEKIRLVKKLEKETLDKRMGQLLKRIDGRRKKYPISLKEITREVEAVRQEIYDRSCR